jgi:hypothetical protein
VQGVLHDVRRLTIRLVSKSLPQWHVRLLPVRRRRATPRAELRFFDL